MIMAPFSSSLKLLLVFFFFAFEPLDVYGQVMDRDGDPIYPNKMYYILSANSPNQVIFAGGAKLGKTDNSTKLTSIVLDVSKDKKGLPVRLTHGRDPNNTGPIVLGEHTTIEFVLGRRCRRLPRSCHWLPKWVVGSNNDDSDYQTWMGAIRDGQDHPGMYLLDGYFSIGLTGSPSGHIYNLAFIFDGGLDIYNVVVTDKLDAQSSGWPLDAWDNGDMSDLYGQFVFAKAH